MKAVIYTWDDEEYSLICRLFEREASEFEIFRAALDGHGHYSVRFDIAVIAINGAEGMETMLELDERFPDTQIIWVTDDKHFAGMALRKHISGFVLRENMENALSSAIREAAEKCRKNTIWHFGKKKRGMA